MWTWNNTSEDQKKEILKIIERGVKDSYRASVKWACYEVLDKNQTLHKRLIERVAESLVSSGKYLALPGTIHASDLDIIRNPEFELNQSFKEVNVSAKKLYDKTLPKVFSGQNKTTYISISLAILSIVFIIISTFLQYTDKTEQEISGIRRELNILNRILRDSTYSKSQREWSLKIHKDSLAHPKKANKLPNISVSVDTLK